MLIPQNRRNLAHGATENKGKIWTLTNDKLTKYKEYEMREP